MTAAPLAFHGNPALKAALLARLDPHGRGGTGPLPIERDLADGKAFAVRHGYPPSLIVLLERIVQSFNTDRDGAAGFVRDWFGGTPVGADLAPVPGDLVLWMLGAALANDPDAGIARRLIDLHRDGSDRVAADGAAWAALRADIVAAGDRAPPGSVEAARIAVWEAAAWPVATSRTILADIAGSWAALVTAAGDGDWTAADEARKEAVLHALAAERAPQRDRGERIDYPRLFSERDPELEARFARHLRMTNDCYMAHWRRLRGECLARLSAAPVAANGAEGGAMTTAPALIPRAALFGHPERFGGSISPDGRWLGWIAPHDGVANIWIAPRERPDAARRLTDDRGCGITGFDWAFDGRHLLFAQDRDGDEQFRLHAVDLATETVRDLTPNLAGQTLLALASVHQPGAVVVSSNARDARFADLFRVDLATGERTLLRRNEGDDFYLLDDAFTVRVAVRTHPDGRKTLMRGDGLGEELVAFTADDARVSGPIGLDRAGETLFLLDSRGRDTVALTALALATGETRVLHEAAGADIAATIGDVRTYRPLACLIARDRAAWVVIDERIRTDVEQLDAAGIGDWSLTGRSTDDRWWTIGAASDTRPGIAWLLDRDTRALTQLYRTRPALDGAMLAAMHPLTIRARDGLSLVSYLTLPPGSEAPGRPGRTATPVPMVLSVHGGPWARDRFGFNPEHQWLANRGYAVLSVNFRGSAGFGKAFLHAGDGAWGAAMDDDLIDAVDWAVAEGIADPARIAIMGASYGGYATLSTMTRFPARFACGIDMVGPSNLETLLAATPPWWQAARAMLHRAIGDPATEDGRRLLHDRSPLHRADRIRRPLLIGQGANDPRVKQAEADQMAAAMRGHGIPVTYLLYPDEGHGFGRPQNALSFNAVREAFLARWLGGRAEPIAPTDIAGSTMQVVEGSDWLAAVLPPLATPIPAGRVPDDGPL